MFNDLSHVGDGDAGAANYALRATQDARHALEQLVPDERASADCLRRLRGSQKSPGYLLALRILLLEEVISNAQREVRDLQDLLQRRGLEIPGVNVAASDTSAFLFGGIAQSLGEEDAPSSSGGAREGGGQPRATALTAAEAIVWSPDGDSWRVRAA